MQLIVARPKPQPQTESAVSVSVIIPCRNERDNVEFAVRRIPEMGNHTEILFCDDKSTDGTGAEVERMIAKYPHRDIRLIPGPGICKAENVWTGFRAAKGDVLMILDGDLAVMPEELPYFLQRAAVGQRRIYQRQPPGLPHTEAGDEVRQHDRQQTVRDDVLLFAGPADQRHALRNQGALEERLASHRTQSRTLGHARTFGAITNSSSAPASYNCRSRRFRYIIRNASTEPPR